MKNKQFILCKYWDGEIFTTGKLYPINKDGNFFTNFGSSRTSSHYKLRDGFVLIVDNIWTRWYYQKEFNEKIQ